MIEPDAIEQSLARALRRDKAPKPGDDEMLRRLAHGVAKTTPPIPRRLMNAHTMPLVGAGIAGVVALVAIAMHHTPPVSRASTIEPAMTTAAPPLAQAPMPIATAVVEAAPIEPAPTASVRVEPSASQLFARANELRRQGHDGEAASTYTTLQQRHPKTPEAIASHMTLGRLLLDRRHEPSRALDQFDRYLASHTHNELREEALIGRALCLEQLGRSDEEKSAWQTLLAEYSTSMYADRARGRLAATLGK